MKRLICALFFVASSCSTDDRPPKGTLSEDKMATILADIHLAEARVSNLGLKSMDSSLLVYEQLERQIWKKYKADTAHYKVSYSYYVSHPKELARIYDKVAKKLEAREKKKDVKL